MNNQSLYQQIRMSVPCGLWQDHSIESKDITLRGLVISSAAKSKVELRVNGNCVGTFFCLPADTTQIDLNLNALSNNITIRVENRDTLFCDFYVMLMLEDNWNEYSAQFDRDIDKTLTT